MTDPERKPPEHVSISPENAGAIEPVPFDTLGGRLSLARESAGLSLQKAARLVGVKTATLQAWESDRSEPRANKLMAMAGVFNANFAWLIHGIGESPVERVADNSLGEIAAELSRLRNFHDQAGKTIAKLEKELHRLRAAD